MQLAVLLGGKKSKSTYISVARPSDTNAEVCKEYPDFCDKENAKTTKNTLKSGDICPRG